MRRVILAVGIAVLATVSLFWPRAGSSAALSPGPDPQEIRSSVGCGTAALAATGRTATLFMQVGELEREARVHLPRGYDHSRPASLVLDFHGYTGTAESEELETTGFSRHADRHGYIIVYPQSTGFVTDTGLKITSWNDLAGNASPGPEGPICSETAFKYAHPPECGDPEPCNWATCHDDLGFVAQLLERLEESLCIDLDRVYATGMSNGGMFVHRLGCAMPERFAAIAPVSGTLARGFNCAPHTSTPLSMMNIYGSRDDYVALDGTMSSDGYFYTSAKDVMSKWASSDSQGCAENPTRYPTSQDGALDLECTQHADCSTGAEVVNCTWDGAHDWPKDDTRDFGNEIIWEFFSKHTRAKYQNVGEGE